MDEERDVLISKVDELPVSSAQVLESDKYNLKYVVFFPLSLALGGLIIGYDSTSIASANLYIIDDIPSYTDTDQQLVSSLALLAAVFGSLMAGPFSNRFGRKKVVVMSDVAIIIGGVIQSSSPTVTSMLIGRVFVGWGMGAAAMVIPMFLAEASPTQIRGAIVATNIIGTTFGQLIGYPICLAFGPNWRLMLALMAVLALLQLILMYFVPDSPRWLFQKNKKLKAIVALRKFFNENDHKARIELESEIYRIEQSENFEGSIPLRKALSELFKVYDRGLLVGIIVMVGQQLSGVSILMYYGPTIIKEAGLGGTGPRDTLINTIPLAIVNFLASVSAIFFSDMKGRRWLVLRMIPFSALAMILVSLGQYMIFYPHAAAGPWVALAGLFLYFVTFSPGLGSQSWVLNSEIHPLQVRSEALSIVTTVVCILTYSTTAFFLTVTATPVGKVATYATIAGVCCLVWILLYNMLPETKGIPLSDIPELFLTPEKKNLIEENNLKFFSETPPQEKYE